MRINIHEVPPEGLELSLTQKEPWVKALLSKAGVEFGESFSSDIQIFRADDSIVFRGSISDDIKLICSRCCKPFSYALERSFTSTYCKGGEKSKAIREEIRLTKDDLDLTFFSGENIDLVDVLSEQVQLAIPYRPLCEEECKGLCAYCGKDLNEGDCKCERGSWSLKFSTLLKSKVNKETKSDITIEK